MTDDATEISRKWTRVCALLNNRGAAYLVVGGVAVGLHGYVRATKDLDILVPKDLENTERILDALSELPWGIAKELRAEDIDEKPITIIGDDPRVDILKAAQSINYDAARGGRLTATIHGTTVPYIGLQDLVRSKTGTNRPKDQQDIQELNRALRRVARQREKRHTPPTEPENEAAMQEDGRNTVKAAHEPADHEPPAGAQAVTTDTVASEPKPIVDRMYAKTMLNSIGAGTAAALGWGLWTLPGEGGVPHVLMAAAGGWIGGIAAGTIGVLLCLADRAVPGWSRRTEASSRIDLHLAAYIVLLISVWSTDAALAARQGATITSFLMICGIMSRRLD